MNARMTQLLDLICRNRELYAAWRQRPIETLRAFGVSPDEPDVQAMRLLEDDAVIDVVFVGAEH